MVILSQQVTTPRSLKSINSAQFSKIKALIFWLVAAGELGRIYSGTIKEHGGRAIDIGFIIEFWNGENLHPRLELYMKRRVFSPLELVLTQFSHCYREAI